MAGTSNFFLIGLTEVARGRRATGLASAFFTRSAFIVLENPIPARSSLTRKTDCGETLEQGKGGCNGKVGTGCGYLPPRIRLLTSAATWCACNFGRMVFI